MMPSQDSDGKGVLDSGYIMMVEPVGFGDGLDEGKMCQAGLQRQMEMTI